jgi:S1/P1 Nuclease
MFRKIVSLWSYRATLTVAGFALIVMQPQMARAWGNDGHQMINQLAASHLPIDVPAFLRSPAAVKEIEYLGPEPDRWRSPAEPELDAAQAPEHFINLELADKLAPLPHKRFDFLAKAYAAGERPDKIGLQPWETDEVWERLKSAMRNYRELRAAGKDTEPVEQAIIFYAGWLGHYVGDGSQPLHTTVQYNGWIGPNPHGYTTGHQIHWQFENVFVSANIHLSDVEAKMTPVKVIHGDMFDAYMAYLRHTHTYVDEVYQLDKEGGFQGAGTPASRAFTAERLADGASMLRDMIYTAWLDSAKPVPERHYAN